MPNTRISPFASSKFRSLPGDLIVVNDDVEMDSGIADNTGFKLTSADEVDVDEQLAETSVPLPESRTLSAGNDDRASQARAGHVPSAAAAADGAMLVEESAIASTGTSGLLRAEWQLGATWNGGYNIHLTVMNDGDEPAENWTLVIEAQGLSLSNSWGVTWNSLGDGRFALTGADYGAILAANGSVDIGFTGIGTPPADLSVIYGTPAEEPTPAMPPEPDVGEQPEGEETGAEESGPVTAEAISATWQVAETWNGGYNMRLTVHNDGRAPVEGWVLVLEAEGLSLSGSWGMTSTDLGDGRVALTGADYAAVLAAGGSVDVGFTGRGVPPEGVVVVRDAAAAPGDTGDGSSDAPDSPFDRADYSEALDLSMEFYYAQYSGDLPDDHPISWRGDSALEDGADVGRDLSGGWYDAGDHMKFGLPMAYTATTLAWGAREYKAGYEAADAYDDVVSHLDWVTDYFLRCYDDKGTADLSDDVFYAQVGDGHLDHAYWGAPEDMTMERPAFAVTAENPGTEVTAETAAAMAASSMVLRDAGRTDRADELLAQAEKLFAFSETYQGVYSDALPEADEFYHSWTGYEDELAWSATWLYEATGDTAYLEKAEAAYPENGIYWALTWDDKAMGTAARLARLTDDQRYFDDLEGHMNHWQNVVARTPGTETNEGLGWLDSWGSNRYAANTAFVALDYATLLDGQGNHARAAELRDFASDQIDYMLGDNPDAFSYVVGFGDNFALNPHHRAASGTTHVGDSDPNQHILYGALVGGPDENGNHQDDRTDYVTNEVAIDYNAGFSGALAALIQSDALVF